MKTEDKTPDEPIIDLFDQKPSGKELRKLLANLTGYKYKFDDATTMKWGKDGKLKATDEENPDGFFQLVPKKTDDGFFEWYTSTRADFQVFKSKQHATLHFIFYWTKWRNENE